MQGSVAAEMAWAMTEPPEIALGDAPPEADRLDLVARARGRDTAAFEVLMKHHERQVYRTALRVLGHPEDARDASQEAFLRMFKYLDRHDGSSDLAPWLYRITINVCRDLQKRRGGREPMSLDSLSDGPTRFEVADPPEQEALISAEDERRIALAGLKTLGEREKAVVVLHDIEGLSTSAVAKTLGSTETTVRSQLSRARLKLARFRIRALGGAS